MLKKILITIAIFSIVQTVKADKTPCYVSVESHGAYTELEVYSIAAPMIRQFIDSNIAANPLAGFSDKACTYRVNIIENSEGLKVSIFGNKIDDYGTSNLRGQAGLEQAILQAIYKGTDNNASKTAICQKYGKRLVNECKGTETAIQKPATQLPPEIEQPETDIADQPPETNNDRSIAGIFKHHDQPSFSVKYPHDWISKQQTRHPNVVFFATAKNKRTPAMEVIVVKPRRKIRDRGIPRFIKKQLKKKLRNSGNFKEIKSKRTTLKDGTSAFFYIIRFKPHTGKKHKITASYIIAEKQGKLVVVSAWTRQKGKALKDINRTVKSLRFH